MNQLFSSTLLAQSFATTPGLSAGESGFSFLDLANLSLQWQQGGSLDTQRAREIIGDPTAYKEQEMSRVDLGTRPDPLRDYAIRLALQPRNKAASTRIRPPLQHETVEHVDGTKVKQPLSSNQTTRIEAQGPADDAKAAPEHPAVYIGSAARLRLVGQENPPKEETYIKHGLLPGQTYVEGGFTSKSKPVLKMGDQIESGLATDLYELAQGLVDWGRAHAIAPRIYIIYKGGHRVTFSGKSFSHKNVVGIQFENYGKGLSVKHIVTMQSTGDEQRLGTFGQGTSAALTYLGSLGITVDIESNKDNMAWHARTRMVPTGIEDSLQLAADVEVFDAFSDRTCFTLKMPTEPDAIKNFETLLARLESFSSYFLFAHPGCAAVLQKREEEHWTLIVEENPLAPKPRLSHEVRGGKVACVTGIAKRNPRTAHCDGVELSLSTKDYTERDNFLFDWSFIGFRNLTAPFHVERDSNSGELRGNPITLINLALRHCTNEGILEILLNEALKARELHETLPVELKQPYGAYYTRDEERDLGEETKRLLLALWERKHAGKTGVCIANENWVIKRLESSDDMHVVHVHGSMFDMLKEAGISEARKVAKLERQSNDMYGRDIEVEYHERDNRLKRMMSEARTLGGRVQVSEDGDGKVLHITFPKSFLDLKDLNDRHKNGMTETCRLATVIASVTENVDIEISSAHNDRNAEISLKCSHTHDDFFSTKLEIFPMPVDADAEAQKNPITTVTIRGEGLNDLEITKEPQEPLQTEDDLAKERKRLAAMRTELEGKRSELEGREQLTAEKEEELVKQEEELIVRETAVDERAEYLETEAEAQKLEDERLQAEAETQRIEDERLQAEAKAQKREDARLRTEAETQRREDERLRREADVQRREQLRLGKLAEKQARAEARLEARRIMLERLKAKWKRNITVLTSVVIGVPSLAAGIWHFSGRPSQEDMLLALDQSTTHYLHPELYTEEAKENSVLTGVSGSPNRQPAPITVVERQASSYRRGGGKDSKDPGPQLKTFRFRWGGSDVEMQRTGDDLLGYYHGMILPNVETVWIDGEKRIRWATPSDFQLEQVSHKTPDTVHTVIFRTLEEKLRPDIHEGETIVAVVNLAGEEPVEVLRESTTGNWLLQGNSNEIAIYTAPVEDPFSTRPPAKDEFEPLVDVEELLNKLTPDLQGFFRAILARQDELTTAQKAAIVLSQWGPNMQYGFEKILDKQNSGPSLLDINASLLNTRHGECDTFATTLALALRLVGVPAHYQQTRWIQYNDVGGFSLAGSHGAVRLWNDETNSWIRVEPQDTDFDEYRNLLAQHEDVTELFNNPEFLASRVNHRLYTGALLVSQHSDVVAEFTNIPPTKGNVKCDVIMSPEGVTVIGTCESVD